MKKEKIWIGDDDLNEKPFRGMPRYYLVAQVGEKPPIWEKIVTFILFLLDKAFWFMFFPFGRPREAIGFYPRFDFEVRKFFWNALPWIIPVILFSIVFLALNWFFATKQISTFEILLKGVCIICLIVSYYVWIFSWYESLVIYRDYRNRYLFARDHPERVEKIFSKLSQILKNGHLFRIYSR